MKVNEVSWVLVLQHLIKLLETAIWTSLPGICFKYWKKDNCIGAVDVVLLLTINLNMFCIFYIFLESLKLGVKYKHELQYIFLGNYMCEAQVDGYYFFENTLFIHTHIFVLHQTTPCFIFILNKIFNINFA